MKNMNFGHRSELRHYDERQRHKAVERIILKVALLGLAAIILLQVFGK